VYPLGVDRGESAVPAARVPADRIRPANDRPERPDRRYVLYWMTAFRRLSSNFALQRAVEAARAFRKPLVVLEGLRADYPWASDRLHRFAIDGMGDHAASLARRRVTYHPYVEPARGAGRGLLEALGADACLVVADDYPCFFLPRMLAAAAGRLDVRVEAVDSNGLFPMRAVDRTFVTALSYRAHVQRTLPEVLGRWPAPIDWSDLPAPAALSGRILERWPATEVEALRSPGPLLASLPIDHGVAPVGRRGGSRAARTVLARFVAGALARYAEDRNHPDLDGTSGLSPYLHFGHVSAHEVFDAVMTAERWTSRRLGRPAGGRRDGWWGVSPGAEAFLDQLVTWRELGFNLCATRPDDYGRFGSLPAWARATLDRHRRDRRRPVYARAQLERAETHDEIWNAAQRQLLRDGRMHTYLRMLWGKKILEWSASPDEALDSMAAIMNRHAIDGRDPNSYAGYSWVLGRYDRPWGPERPIFGTVRYMSSESARRKIRLKRFLLEYGA
jgi:deoxyribodipyrimidine photo-lyase